MAALRSTMPLRLRANVGAPLSFRQVARNPLPRRLNGSNRGYATSPAGGTSGGFKVSGSNVIAAAAILLGGGVGFYLYNQDGKKDILDVGVGRGASKLGGAKARSATDKSGVGSFEDYQQVSDQRVQRRGTLTHFCFLILGLQRNRR